MKTLKDCYAEGIAKALYFEQRRLEEVINENINLINNLQLQNIDNMDTMDFHLLATAKMELRLAYLGMERLKQELSRQDDNTKRVFALYIIEQNIWEAK